jgi:hypothetical protein
MDWSKWQYCKYPLRVSLDMKSLNVHIKSSKPFINSPQTLRFDNAKGGGYSMLCRATEINSYSRRTHQTCAQPLATKTCISLIKHATPSSEFVESSFFHLAILCRTVQLSIEALVKRNQRTNRLIQTPLTRPYPAGQGSREVMVS